MIRSRILRAVSLGLLMAGFTGCSDGIRQHIRQRDFRADRAAEHAANLPPPSPIANVADMPGWTTDLDGATAFARDQGRKTVVFVQAGSTPHSQAMKTSLLSEQMRASLSNAEKVTFDANSSPDLASRFGVPAPSVLVLDMNGTAVGQQQSTINKAGACGGCPLNLINDWNM